MRRSNMKKNTKLVALLLSLAMLIGLVGCGSGGEEKKAADANEIIIGGNLELSGAVATYGATMKNGAELYFEEVNAAGGINGKKIKFLVMDNK
jgi:branched-chain amino acid transport system substrate-binding protein